MQGPLAYNKVVSGAYSTLKDKAHTGAKLYTSESTNEVVRPTDLVAPKHLTVTIISDSMARK